MEAKQLEYYKQRLLEKRNALIDSVRKSETYGREAETQEELMDLVDKASSAYTKELMFSKSNSDRRFLQTVAQALERIEAGEYGVCSNCEEDVEPKRLEAVPWAGLCLKCKELEEQGKL